MATKSMHQRTPPGSQVAVQQVDVVGSVFILGTEPLNGIWFRKGGCQPGGRWTIRDGTVVWEPSTPLNASGWQERIGSLALVVHERREHGSFLKVTRTSITPYNWSLPAIAACPVQDETCSYCYALARRYAIQLTDQVDRVLRLEYLQRLMREHRLHEWTAWMVSELNGLRPGEPFETTEGGKALEKGATSAGRVVYMRWHDSGDVFSVAYGRAILEVCAATLKVMHYLPTRMGSLFKSLVEHGCVIPPNLALQVSIHRGGQREREQLQAMREILKIQPSAQVGISYFVTGQGRWAVGMDFVKRTFGSQAVACPVTTARDPKQRTCAGCRNCWAARYAAIFFSTR